MRIYFKCVLNSHGFGIRSSEIACDFRIANEVEMGHKATLLSQNFHIIPERCFVDCGIKSLQNLLPVLRVAIPRF